MKMQGSGLKLYISRPYPPPPPLCPTPERLRQENNNWIFFSQGLSLLPHCDKCQEPFWFLYLEPLRFYTMSKTGVAHAPLLLTTRSMSAPPQIWSQSIRYTYWKSLFLKILNCSYCTTWYLVGNHENARKWLKFGYFPPQPPSAPPAKLCATPNMTWINLINLLKEIITKHNHCTALILLENHENARKLELHSRKEINSWAHHPFNSWAHELTDVPTFQRNTYFLAQLLRNNYLQAEIYQHWHVYLILKCADEVQRSV